MLNKLRFKIDFTNLLFISKSNMNKDTDKAYEIDQNQMSNEVNESNNTGSKEEKNRIHVTSADIKTLSGQSRQDLLEEMSKTMRDIQNVHLKGEEAMKKKKEREAKQTNKDFEYNTQSETTNDVPIDGDYINGSRVFMRNCAGCHGLESNNQGRQSVTGPPLGLIYGRKVGNDKWFNYSKNYIDSRSIWNERSLFHYLKNPQAYYNGSRCIIRNGGIVDESDRIDIVNFLKLFTKNLKLNLDLRNRRTLGNDYVNNYNKSQENINEEIFKRARGL